MISIYATIIGTIAGICLGYAILYLFVGLRRKDDKRLNLSFALFAFGYAGTLLLGIWYRGQTTVADYIAISRWDGIFIWLAFVALNWYVAEYTGIRARLYLWGFTAVYTVTILALMLTPTLSFVEMPVLTSIPLPWNEQIPTLSGEENVWGVLLLLAQLATLLFIIIAGVRQWRRGQRQAAAVLLGGMSWFIISLSYEILAEAGLFVYIPFAESGFLGIAIAMSLQMANSALKAEEALAAGQRNLEALVIERTAKLEEAQEQLIIQAQKTAVSEERQRIARDLHDDVTQTIYSATLIAEVLPQVWQRNAHEGQRNLNKLRQLVRGALAEMRTMLFELRPAALETTELETLLPQLGDSLTGRTRIPVDVTIDGQGRLPVSVKIAFYRIAQEAFNNIGKHAGARQVTAKLTHSSDTAVLSIVDDGQGIDESGMQANGMGLHIMRERAEGIGATLEIKGEPAQGTTLTVIWSRANVANVPQALAASNAESTSRDDTLNEEVL